MKLRTWGLQMNTGDGVRLDDGTLRERLASLLSGLETNWRDRPANTEEETGVVSKLQRIAEPYDYKQK